MIFEKNPNSHTAGSVPKAQIDKTAESLSRRHTTLFHLRIFLTNTTNEPKNSIQKRWEHRWIAASAAWIAVLLVLLFGEIDWRAPVMVAAAAFMVARGGDMLDDFEKY